MHATQVTLWLYARIQTVFTLFYVEAATDKMSNKVYPFRNIFARYQPYYSKPWGCGAVSLRVKSGLLHDT